MRKNIKLSQEHLDEAINEFLDHRLWLKVLNAYTVQSTWTIKELQEHLKVPKHKNIIAYTHKTLSKLGYALMPVDKNTKRSKYYLKKYNNV